MLATPLMTMSSEVAPQQHAGVVHHIARIKQHADRDKEKTRERVAKRERILQRAVTVLGIGQNETGQKRAQRKREPEQGR